ncbi:MAG: asparaginase [Gemmatimonadaceae bacterium]
MKSIDIDIVATRGPAVESTHRVHAAVVDATGALIAQAHDVNFVTVWRSCAKPFQLLPFLESGELDALDWDAREIALACASHGGEPEHVALAADMLERLGLEEGDLACGPHEPLSRRGARLMLQSGERPTRLHNNCSGKHAAMLAHALRKGWPTLGYEQDAHPVQQSALASVAQWSGVPADRIARSVDGCGVSAFSLPLRAMALAFARFGAAGERGDESPARILAALRANPFLLGGTDRFDTVLLEETGGRVIAKVGAEGVHSIAVPEQGIGAAIKVADGAPRAQHPAVIRLLQHLAVLPASLSPRLAAILETPILNTRGTVVGAVRPAA